MSAAQHVQLWQLGEIALLQAEIIQRIELGALDAQDTLQKLREILGGESFGEKSTRKITFAPRERQFLEYVIKNAGNACTFEDFIQAIWGRVTRLEKEASDKRRLVAIALRVQEKLRRISKPPGMVENIRGVGYRWKPLAIKNSPSST